MYWQLCRNHELHYANSSTSFHDFIYFIELTHTAAVAEGVECCGWRSRMQWPKETNAIAEGVECGGWRSRMRWPKESNAVAGGDTFWTLITRDCCIILNWVHLKKSRIIFFVIVTYWQSMARFRKNDFFKWAQKIKSVFCFIPHTHEGCDVDLRDVFKHDISFNPHTHEGCDNGRFLQGDELLVSIHTPTKGVTQLSALKMYVKKFQSTHPRRVWLANAVISAASEAFQSTHPRRVWLNTFRKNPYFSYVSIHTPTKGVTLQ